MNPTNAMPLLAPQMLAGATNGLHDIRPPFAIPSGWAWLGWVILALLVAGLGLAAWLLLRKRRATAQAPAPLPAHVRAKQKLREALAWLDQPEPFCVLVSGTIRVYLEERFDFHAPERTTEEFLHELRGTHLLLPDQKQSLARFLNSCDLVKFARYEPAEPELRGLHDSAWQLVEETEPKPPPPEVAQPAVPAVVGGAGGTQPGSA